MPSNTEFTDMQQRNVQTLSDIQGLQSIERELFKSLDSGIANNTLTTQQKNDIIQKINQLSEMRINLYKNLNGMYTFFQNNLVSSRDTLVEQSGAVEIVENELNDAKKKLSSIRDDTTNKLRLVEINTYYGEKYNEHANIMKLVVYTCIPIIILTILLNMGFLSLTIYVILMVIIINISIFYIGRDLLFALSHDNMNYQQYVWNIKPSELPKINLNNPGGTGNPWAILPNINIPRTCIGEACCSEFTEYNSDVNQCIMLGSLNPAELAPTSPPPNMSTLM